MRHVLSLSTLYPNAANPRFGTFVARSLEALAKRGDWRVSVVNPIGLPPLGLGSLSARYRELQDLPILGEEGGVSVHRPRFTLIPKIGARRNAESIAKAVLPIAQAIHSKTPIDLIDAQFFFPDGPAAAILADEMGLPFSMKARGSDITYWGGFEFARAQMVNAAAKANGLLAVSEALSRDMAKLGINQSAIKLHYTGLDRDLFRPLDHAQLRAQLSEKLGFSIAHNAPLFACVGALTHRKGQAIALRALAQISDEHPEARMLLVGKGEDAGSLQELARELDLADRVHLTGAIDHNLLPIILSAADAMVLPTQNEGLANAWVEALACGTPLVTCDVGGARELVTNETAGYLVERTPEAVAEGMRMILSSPRDPQEVAQMAARFDWRTHADSLADYFAGLTQ